GTRARHGSEVDFLRDGGPRELTSRHVHELRVESLRLEEPAVHGDVGGQVEAAGAGGAPDLDLRGLGRRDAAAEPERAADHESWPSWETIAWRSAGPRACMAPPRSWPSTPAGLIARPGSDSET